MAAGVLVKVNLGRMAEHYIGIDIGGTFVKGVLIREEEVLIKTTKDTRDEKGQWQSSVAQIYRDLAGQCQGEIAGIGLSAPGIADSQNKTITCMPGRLNGLEGFNWSNYLDHSVYVLNDAHAALISESQWGVAKGCPNVVMLTLGTGVGGGLLIDGKLVQGFLQRAGHLGHISIDCHNDQPDITGITGSLEDAIGECTLQHRSLGKFNKTKDLVAAYQTGDTWATYLWLKMIRSLALGIVSFCNTVSPEIVVLAGGITAAGEKLLKPLSEFMALYEWRIDGHATPVKLAQFEEFAGSIGAALFARSQNYKS
jgi:glucokinase